MSRATPISCFLLAGSLALALLARPAAAAPTPPRTAPTPADYEALVGTGQILAGAGVSLGTLLVSVAASSGGEVVGALALLAGPALTGSVVCWVGGKSARYDQGCGIPILGAYLGALTIIPAGMLGAHLADSGEMDMSGFFGSVAGIVLAWIIMQPVVSTVFWHIWKDPRPATSEPPRLRSALAGGGLGPPLLGLRPPPPGLTRPRASRLPGELTIPLLRTTF
jgi:hypothetical protein